MVRKELYVYSLAYNLLRTLIWQAGTTYSTPPLHLSLQGTRHPFANFIPDLLGNSGVKCHQIYQILLKIIVHKPGRCRTGRVEPRVRKRRPKAYPLMKQSRNQLRRQLQAV